MVTPSRIYSKVCTPNTVLLSELTSALAVPSTSVVVVEPSLFVTVTVVLPSDDVPVDTVGE